MSCVALLFCLVATATAQLTLLDDRGQIRLGVAPDVVISRKGPAHIGFASRVNVSQFAIQQEVSIGLPGTQVQLSQSAGALSVSGAIRAVSSEAAPFPCDSAHEGFTYYNSAEHVHRICRNSTGWVPMGNPVGAQAQYSTCKQLLAVKPATPSGWYFLRIFSHRKVLVYCDMTTLFGTPGVGGPGLTRIWASCDTNPNTELRHSASLGVETIGRLAHFASAFIVAREQEPSTYVRSTTATPLDNLKRHRPVNYGFDSAYAPASHFVAGGNWAVSVIQPTCAVGVDSGLLIWSTCNSYGLHIYPNGGCSDNTGETPLVAYLY